MTIGGGTQAPHRIPALAALIIKLTALVCQTEGKLMVTRAVLQKQRWPVITSQSIHHPCVTYGRDRIMLDVVGVTCADECHDIAFLACRSRKIFWNRFTRGYPRKFLPHLGATGGESLGSQPNY
mmetsp:Transcript_12258/g.18821  ORF Transcript_12258/g.18821 Transcript_12258/m.18821 type:complete len:124 (-) Transcript_12258:581-952(-)